MFLHIERGSSTPISRQIAEQIAALCAAGSLKTGDRLPSVRQLALELAVNQNTVLRVYEKLAGEGVLEMRHGEGTFVAAGAPRRRLEKQRRQFQGELERVVRRGLMLGLPPEEIRELCQQSIETAALSLSTAAPAAGG